MEATLNKTLSRSAGLLFLLLGVLLNEWVITWLISPDGSLESPSTRVRIWSLNLLFLVTGIILLRTQKTFHFQLRQWICTAIGLGFIILGVVLSEWIVARIFILDGKSIQPVVLVIDAFLIVVGINFIYHRDTLSLKILTANYALIVYSVILTLIGAEIFLRVLKYRPYTPPTYNIRVEPGGKMYQPHETLGYTHIPGEFRVTMPPDNRTFTLTHLPNTLRITHPVSTYETADNKEQILIFGCSFTHGWGLNDNETFPWLLQDTFPGYDVVNFGVDGYGTLQSFLQFQQALKENAPAAIAILAYAGFHDERNTFLRIRRKTIVAVNWLGPQIQPYARFDKHGQLQYRMAEVTYQPFPFMQHSALIHLLENAYNTIEAALANSHEVSKAIIKDFSSMAESHNIRFIVAGISADAPTHDMLEYCREIGIESVDISVDLTQPDYILSTYDPHPNALANTLYAQKLISTIKTPGKTFEGRSRP